MPELATPKKKRSSAEEFHVTSESKVEDSVTADGSLNTEEKMEIAEMEFKTSEVKVGDFEQKSSKDPECAAESTCSKSKVRDLEFSSLDGESKDIESSSLNEEANCIESSSLNEEAKNVESNSLNGEKKDFESSTLNIEAKVIESSSLNEETQMNSQSGKGGKSEMTPTLLTPTASSASNKRGLSPTESLLKPVEKKKRKEYFDKCIQVLSDIGFLTSEDLGKTSTRAMPSLNNETKNIFEEVNPLPYMLKFEESIQTFILGSQFRLDPDSVCKLEKLSQPIDTDKLYEFWKMIKEIVWHFHNQVRSVVHKFGPFCKLTPEELKHCIDSIKESTNLMREFYEVCVKELRNWWNLTKVFDGIFFLGALLNKIYSKVKLDSRSLADKNSELNSNIETKRMSGKSTSNSELKDSEPSLTGETENVENSSNVEVEKRPPNKNSLSVELSKNLEKKIVSPGKMTQILKQLWIGEDEILSKNVLSAIVKPPVHNTTPLDFLEKVNLFPAMLKFERTLETFLFYSEFGLDSASKLDSNPKLVELWKKNEGAVLDFKKQAQAIICKLGPVCDLTLDNLKTYVCNLKTLTDKMKESRKVCFKELKKWWNLTQVFNNMFALESSLNDIFSKIEEVEADIFSKIEGVEADIFSKIKETESNI